MTETKEVYEVNRRVKGVEGSNKSPRKIRGEWYKATREAAVTLIQQKHENEGKIDESSLDRTALSVYWVSVYYKLLLRLPHIREYRPDWTEKAQAMVDYCEKELHLFAPYLKLQKYEGVE